MAKSEDKVEEQANIEVIDPSVELEEFVPPKKVVISKKPVGDTSPEAVIAVEGESYASIAVRLAPEGVSPHEFAKTLFALNNGAPVRPGARVKVK